MAKKNKTPNDFHKLLQEQVDVVKSMAQANNKDNVSALKTHALATAVNICSREQTMTLEDVIDVAKKIYDWLAESPRLH